MHFCVPVAVAPCNRGWSLERTRDGVGRLRRLRARAQASNPVCLDRYEMIRPTRSNLKCLPGHMDVSLAINGRLPPRISEGGKIRFSRRSREVVHN
jgi:hypothetical protein